jgi:hypothetical protein
MAQHRNNPACATCHARIDLLGMALENFDGVGKWRDATPEGVPIAGVGMLPDGSAFGSIVEARMALLKRRGVFATSVVQDLLAQALQRQLQDDDMPTVRAIVRRTASTNFRWSSIIGAIVRSSAFQMNRRPLA